MDANYYYLNNFKNNGYMGISRRCFEEIATIATNSISDVNVKKKGTGFFSLANPVVTTFRKDGKVDITIDVAISKKTNASMKDICLKIQETVASSIAMMCEAVPFKINVKVSSVY